MNESSVAVIATLIGTTISTVGTVIIEIINRDRKKQNERAEKTNELLSKAIKEINAGNKVSVATARSVIAQIYNQQKNTQCIEQGVWESVSDLYDAYKGITINGHTPNSWCDSMVDEMRCWRKI